MGKYHVLLIRIGSPLTKNWPTVTTTASVKYRCHGSENLLIKQIVNFYSVDQNDQNVSNKLCKCELLTKWFSLLCVYIERLLWNHLKFWGTFRGLCMFCLFVGMSFPGCLSFLVSVKKMTLNKFVFVDNVNSWGKATYNFHKNRAAMSSNDSTENIRRMETCNRRNEPVHWWHLSTVLGIKELLWK